uniref:Uncharacterized protein n=1 Tax=Arundo donax TaxID=35708 RepID=A0A0A8Z2D8_ARUDO
MNLKMETLSLIVHDSIGIKYLRHFKHTCRVVCPY